MTDTQSRESDTEDQNSWVLDSLVGFLKGPVWGLTIQSFIEQKSVIFDPEEDVCEDVIQEYRVLYEEYKNLVDRLLSSHMSDLEISAEQFDEACRRADGLLASKFKQILFEQIWAANDYQIFVRFMTQRNIELQLQALEILAQRFGLIYEAFIPMGTNREDLLNDELVINEAIKRSLTESDSNEDSKSSEEIKDINRESLQVLEEKRRLEGERLKEQEKLSMAIQSVLTLEAIPEDNPPETEKEVKSEPKSKRLPKLKEESIEYKTIDTNESQENQIQVEEEDKNEGTVEERAKTAVRGVASEVGSGFSVEEIRKRSEYLRKQRDKLLEIKKQERNKQMSKVEEQELLAKRPKSARAMRSVTDKTIEASDEDQSLAFRRSLAARLKAEVIEQHKH